MGKISSEMGKGSRGSWEQGKGLGWGENFRKSGGSKMSERSGREEIRDGVSKGQHWRAAEMR